MICPECGQDCGALVPTDYGIWLCPSCRDFGPDRASDLLTDRPILTTQKKPLFVLDLETTGLDGTEMGDKILEVGVARVDLIRGVVYPEYGQIVHQFLTPAEKTCWCFTNTSLNPSDVTNSPWPLHAVLGMLKLYDTVLHGVFTSYNAAFDFDLFLKPWGFRPRMAPCIMKECADHYNGGRWFKAQEAYDQLCPDNPAALPDKKEEHRALSDAVMEGWILLRYLEDNPDAKQRYLRCLQ